MVDPMIAYWKAAIRDGWKKRHVKDEKRRAFIRGDIKYCIAKIRALLSMG